MKMSFLELEDEVLELDTTEVVCNYQNYGARTAVKYGLCKVIKTAYNQFRVGFMDYYNNGSLKTTIVDLNSYNVIVDSNEFTEILEQYYYSVAPATNLEAGNTLLGVINRLFIKCRDYAEEQAYYYYNF